MNTVYRLGYYKTKIGKGIYGQVVYINENNDQCLVVFEYEEEETGEIRFEQYRYNLEGKKLHSANDDFDLVEYISHINPNIRRRFRFEAWIGENPTNRGGLESINRESALDAVFGYSCGHKLVLDKKSYAPPHYEKVTRWEVVLRELSSND